MKPTLLGRARKLVLLSGLFVVAVAGGADAGLVPPTVLGVAPPSDAVGFGGAVAGLGDANGDGVGDAVVGAPGSGHAYVVSGATRTIMHKIADPAGIGFNFGSAVAAVGDINGDGVADFAVGASSGPDPARGGVFVFSGATGALVRQLVPPTTDYLAFGRSVTGAGDLSGDGVPDIVVGAPGLKQGRGTVFAFSGANGMQLWSRLEPSAQLEPVASFGELVAATSDVSGDGVVDVLVSAPLASYGSQPVARGGNVVIDVLAGLLDLVLSPVSAGRVHVLSGANGDVIRSMSDPAPYDEDAFGGAVAAIGDQDGDGIVDHLVGERGANQLHLYSGRDGVLIRSIAAPADDQAQGIFTLAHVDDKDGDGRDDFWLGNASARTAYLLNGIGTVLSSATAPSPQGTFAAAVAPVGNMGGDPGVDLVVGDPTEPGGGAVYLLQSGANAPRVAHAGTDQVAECSSVTCENLVRLRAQTPVPTTTTPTTTTPLATTTTPPTTSVAPATATLPRPASEATAETNLPGTGGVDRSAAGVAALGLGMTGITVLRRLRQPSIRGEPPSTG